MSKIVIALGGNALGNTPKEQYENAIITAKEIVSIIGLGNLVTITHGNGPQIGMINSGFETASSQNKSIPIMPFPECGAMSQGYIGYHLQNAIQNELKRNGIQRDVISIITQIEVNPDDHAFLNPTKPIGRFYNEDEAIVINKEKNYIMKEDAGRGFRRVVPSPFPINIIEINVIKTLIENNHIVITCGGGGIPVIRNKDFLKGVDAVIDKDYASSLLARQIDADILLILTAIDHVMINFNKVNQKELKDISLDEAKLFLQNNEFASGSMEPKIKAGIDFLETNPYGTVIITSLGNAEQALSGHFGTRIKNLRRVK